MNLSKIYIKSDSPFGSYIQNWASNSGVEVEMYDAKLEDEAADGLLLINANQDIDRESDEIHALFDKKHIPTQKIDVNGTLQVALSSLDLWLKSNKCSEILILGSDKLVENENLDRFFNKLSMARV
jgi:hypothetical protein